MKAGLLEACKQRYLERKGYAAVPGQKYVFARKETIGKAVAFFDGLFNRDAYKQVMEEVKSLGLNTVTVLVNGLITYSGSGFNAVRVDAGYDAGFTGEDIDHDFMADTRLAKQQKRNASRRM